MPGRQLYQDLAAVRALVADGRDRLRDATGDLDQFALNSARHRLLEVDDCLIMAASGLGGWSRVAAGTPAMLLAAAATALVTRALGFPVFWVVACSWIVAVLVEHPVRKWTMTRLGPWLGRRRLARAAVTVEPSSPRDLAGLPDALADARTRLVSAILRAAGSRHWQPAYLAHAVAGSPTFTRLAAADTMLCQAIDHIEQYLAAETKEQP
ncbi:MAG TPA: hypothetical protein VGD29_21820 [Actinoplanes sp.]|jgi:hypothetical protein